MTDDIDPEESSLEASPADEESLKTALHRIFDRQIPNYASYNLVYGYGSAEYPVPRAGKPPGTRRDFIIGYCMNPLEVVLAPFVLPELSPVEPATAVNATNLVFAESGTAGYHELETNTGCRLSFTARGRVPIPFTGVTHWLEQQADVEDFARFMTVFGEL